MAPEDHGERPVSTSSDPLHQSPQSDVLCPSSLLFGPPLYLFVGVESVPLVSLVYLTSRLVSPTELVPLDTSELQGTSSIPVVE